jgi:hypothetical protein
MAMGPDAPLMHADQNVETWETPTANTIDSEHLKQRNAESKPPPHLKRRSRNLEAVVKRKPQRDQQQVKRHGNGHQSLGKQEDGLQVTKSSMMTRPQLWATT